MPLLATLGGTVDITESTPGTVGASLGAFLDVDDGSPFEFDVAINHAAQLAAASTFQRLGIRIDIDLGDGLQTIPASDLGTDVTVTESTSQFSDVLRFSLIGPKYSPFARSVTRAKRQVVAYVTYGAPGREYSARIFTGYITEAPFTVQPPVANVTAMDAAALYATLKAKDFAVSPNSNRARLAVLTELLGIVNIPARFIDIGGDGGKITKPFTPGDTEILQLLADWLTPTGARIGFEDGGFVARRYDPAAPFIVELTPADICTPFTMLPPTTMAATKVVVVAVKFETVSADGVRTEVEEVLTMGIYTPARANGYHDADGVFHAMAVSGPPLANIVISSLRTETTYRGGTAVRIEETEKGWYAPQVADQMINMDETIHPWLGRVYHFEDDTWRTEFIESFRTIRSTVTTRDTDANDNIVKTTESRYFYHFARKAIWRVDATGGGGIAEVVVADHIALLPSGDGVYPESEFIGFAYGKPDSQTVTELALNDDGTISAETVTEFFYDIGARLTRTTIGAYGYGMDNRIYATRQQELDPFLFGYGADWYGGRRVQRTTYRAMDEDRFQTIQTVRVNGGAPLTTITTGSGTLPRPQRIEPQSKSQEIKATVTDELRLAMNGEQEEDIHNEYIESSDEARVVAVNRLRELSAIPFTFDMPVEGTIHKWAAISMTYPSANIFSARLEVTDVTRNLSRFRQTIRAVYYPPEIV